MKVTETDLSAQMATWIAFGAVSMVIQLSLMSSAYWTIWKLQMPLKRKAGLSIWFSLSLLYVLGRS